MDRKGFLKELEFLLQDIDDQERIEALKYYYDYFDEAGVENEAKVIEELGSPEKVAAVIKAGLDNTFHEDIEYSEKGMDNSNYKETKEIIEAEVVEPEAEKREEKSSRFVGDPDRNRILLIAIVIGIIIVCLPIGGGFLAGMGGLFLAFLGIGFAIMVGGIACAGAAVTLIVKGIVSLAGYPGGGLLLLAGGILLIALSIIFFKLAAGLVGLIPKIIRGIIDLARKLIEMVGDRR